MTYIFNTTIGANRVDTDAPEWNSEFLVSGENGRKTLEIVDAWRSGTRPTLPDEMPKLLVADKPRKIWPDTFMTTNGLLVVNGDVRAVIEKLDPNTHQFFPLTFRTKRGVIIDGPWFAMNVSKKQDTLAMGRCHLVFSEKYPDTGNLFHEDTKDGEITVDPALQSKLNLWRESRVEMSLLGSNALVLELEKQGLSFFKKSAKAAEYNMLQPS